MTTLHALNFVAGLIALFGGVHAFRKLDPVTGLLSLGFGVYAMSGFTLLGAIPALVLIVAALALRWRERRWTL